MTEIMAVALIVAVALALRLIVDSIMKRLAIFPDDESERSNGLRDVIERIQRHRKRD